jgi:hypothetical protein
MRGYAVLRMTPAQRLRQRAMTRVRSVGPPAIDIRTPPAAAAASYSFDGGLLIDTSGNGFTPVGTGATFGAGKFGLALTAGVAEVETGVLPATNSTSGSYTFGGWMRANTGAVNSRAIQLSGASGAQASIFMSSAGQIIGYVRDIDFELVGPTVLNAAAHVAMRVSGGTAELLVNGAVVDSIAVSGGEVMDASFRMEAGTSGGYLDDVFAAATAYTAGQLLYLQTNPHPTGTP